MGADPDPVDASLHLFSGYVFHFATFDEQRFGDDHYHCHGCWKTITEPKYKGEHEGYVTIHKVQYAGFPVSMQYSWVCNECFLRYRETYRWQVSPESVPEIPIEVMRAFDAAYKTYLARKRE